MCKRETDNKKLGTRERLVLNEGYGAGVGQKTGMGLNLVLMGMGQVDDDSRLGGLSQMLKVSY